MRLNLVVKYEHESSQSAALWQRFCASRVSYIYTHSYVIALFYKTVIKAVARDWIILCSVIIPYKFWAKTVDNHVCVLGISVSLKLQSKKAWIRWLLFIMLTLTHCHNLGLLEKKKKKTELFHCRWCKNIWRVRPFCVCVHHNNDVCKKKSRCDWWVVFQFSFEDESINPLGITAISTQTPFFSEAID